MLRLAWLNMCHVYLNRVSHFFHENDLIYIKLAAHEKHGYLYMYYRDR